MSFQANWDIQGVRFENSANAFIKSAQKVSNPTVLKKYEASLDKRFKEYLRENMRRAGMEADNLADVFSVIINNNGINFINTEPLITQRYEYGYIGSKDTNEEYYEEYMIQTSPTYFIRPSIQASMNDVGQIMLEEAKKEYYNNRRFE